MDYIKINKDQREKIKQITSNNFEMEWSDPKLLDILLGSLSRLENYHCDEPVRAKVNELEKIYSSYNIFTTSKMLFLNDVKKIIDEIISISPTWYGLNLLNLEQELKLHGFCLIRGAGGIGKSYFIKCLEEKMEELKIPHLCVYGKFLEDISMIDFEQISKISEEEGFVIIIDALNEFSNDNQNKLLEEIKKLKKNKVRFIISYRTHTISSEVLKSYEKLSDITFDFPGVSFESALDELTKKAIPDIYKYENILFSNNALILNMLCEILNNDKITKEEINSLVSITYIYEQYFKKVLDKTLKQLKIKRHPIEFWKDTKKIANWMYANDIKRIDINSLNSLLDDSKLYIDVLNQAGFLNAYEYNSILYVYFSMDSLADFLIARSLFEELADKSEIEQIKLITTKSEAFYEIREALILVIFDYYGSNYNLIFKILKETSLIEIFNYEMILKIHFDCKNIPEFLKYFKPSDFSNLINTFGGFTNKPFNCVNCLNQYYKDKKKQTIELSRVLSDNYYLSETKGRLKNLLYFINLNDKPDKRLDEAFYFAVWCCAAPNQDVRLLSVKLLYDIVIENEKYRDILISEYFTIKDFYIKECIIHVLSNYHSLDTKVINFFNSLIKSDDLLTSKSVKRISKYLPSNKDYIDWNKKNLLLINTNYEISEELNSLLFKMDLMDKHFMPFRYWGKDRIDMYHKFMGESKDVIKEYNRLINEKFECVKYGECRGTINFEKHISDKIDLKYNNELIDINSYLFSLENILKDVFDYYNQEMNDNTKISLDRNFHHSVFLKCVDIAVGLLYASLMCNYYLKDFSTFNNVHNTLGFDVYDPFEYGEEINIISPIPIYQSIIERLNQKIINKIFIPNSKNVEWGKNIELTKNNLLSLFSPISVNKTEWVLLAGRISIKYSEGYDLLWADNYDVWFCTSSTETIYENGNARYLTIELNNYHNCIKEYPNCVEQSYLCKSIKELKANFKLLDSVSLVFPPSDLIKYFNLRFCKKTASWINDKNESVILCNNNKSSYYNDMVTSSIYIRKDYLDEYRKNNQIKYFCFTERYTRETGYSDETSVHFEVIDEKINKEILNYKNYGDYDNTSEKCTMCHIGLNDTETNLDLKDEWLEYIEIIKKQGYSDGEDN